MQCLQAFLTVQTGKITAENRIHDLDIKDMRFSKDGTHFVTASGDRTSKIVDAQDLTVMKEFAFERPANAADMSPIADHVRLQPHLRILHLTSSCLHHMSVSWFSSSHLHNVDLACCFGRTMMDTGTTAGCKSRVRNDKP